MRTEKEMFDLILGVAEKDERILGVYMNGSRANPKAPKDIFQDFDIVYVVKETKSFIRDKEWVDIFGERLIMQLPDELDKIAGIKTNFKNDYGYLMQFIDGNRIDLHIQTKEFALKELKRDKLSIILLDKDNIFPKLPEPTDEEHWIKKPTEKLFYRACNEFWWVSIYVAKGLWRDEIPYAMDNLNFNARPQLIQMLSWYVGISTNFSCSVGKSGKYLKNYLPDEIWDRFLKTYPAGNVTSIWDSLFAMGELFKDISREISHRLGFVYNQEAERCFSYLIHISQLPKNAKEII